MGQQQLLLVILVTIIVGIATVVAINIFGQAADQANRDAVRQDLLGAAVQAQAIWSRPQLMAGADRDFAGTYITPAEIMSRLGIPGQYVTDITGETASPTPTTFVRNENGVYGLAVTDSRTLTITGYAASGPPNMVMEVANNATTGNWDIEITDVTPE